MVLFFIHSIQDQKLPGPPAYIFMIDVSYQSMQCGMVRMLMKELKELLDVLPKWALHIFLFEGSVSPLSLQLIKHNLNTLVWKKTHSGKDC